MSYHVVSCPVLLQCLLMYIKLVHMFSCAALHTGIQKVPAPFCIALVDADSALVYMQNIHLTAYSPLGTPDSAAQQNRSDQTPHLMSDPDVKKIADKHGKHTAPVSLRLPFLPAVLGTTLQLSIAAHSLPVPLCCLVHSGPGQHHI